MQLTPFIPAENAQKAAQRTVKLYQTEDIKLDYSVGSLHVVDGLIDDLRFLYHHPGRVQSLIYGLGCYTGEVIIRVFGGRWVSGSQTDQPLVQHIPLLLQVGQTFCNPINKVALRFDHGLTYGATALYLLLHTHLPRRRQRSYFLNLF